MSKTLLLVPTRREIEGLDLQASEFPDLGIEVVGLGLVESAIRAFELISQSRPERLLLAGIAGLFSKYADLLESAACFQTVTQFGTGSFGKKGFRSAAEMEDALDPEIPAERDRDFLSLETPAGLDSAGLLVSVTASGLFAEADIIDYFRQRVPDVDPVAEDMEGYAVARVAKRFQMPLTIVRGFSNLVSDRDVTNWKIDQAMGSVSRVLRKLLNQPTSEKNP